MENDVRTASCVCGKVQFSAIKRPILSAICYCDDCQKGGRQIEGLPNAAKVRDEDGGTHYLTYRDDRWTCLKGEEFLVDLRNDPASPTRRIVAGCCNSGMYLKYAPGFWVSTYRHRYAGDVPPVEMRNQTRFRRSALPIPDDAPSFGRFPLRLFAKLLAARIGMMLGR